MAEILKFDPRRGRLDMLNSGRGAAAAGSGKLRTLQRDRMRAVWRQDANGRLFMQWKIDNDVAL